ncbi:PAS sensor protein [Streptomyces agglomeratus]|uniref:protein-serine/threonine phosphatase n=1 Tax=Streptomyces agglomeratus TaxID=285458 RepID=A0A1E5PG23_9ACTN|nr:SpoIIE family protein phosphatase [Streptomyces agglomeratus]OEJ28493.1 PAS sensor protein [Streptomyces agglomeratus]OEJ37442.1 PAS sensor protein [Streptomyces agglomeratus]OEJ48172.1 PAS sensor protein [Streptomyces agglomeratus]OEJ49984.1 PAS sensor protein [Streptomyces agglomeratus]OEJ57312.1 PAS sensor protein [Streptomyces agglomeratus]
MQQPGGPGQGTGPDQLDSSVAALVRDAGASVALVYLLPPGERVLQLAVVSGVSRRIAAPWARIAVEAPIPVAEAVRERHQVWLGSQEEVARRYPQLGLVLPYDFMLAATPITSGTTVWGGVVLLWPIRHSPQLSSLEREAIAAFCRRTGLLLRQGADSGHPVLPAPEPRVLAPPRSRSPERAEALAAVDFAERLPLGCCALDLDGRITFITATAADLVGAGAVTLTGARPWEVLLWLQDPVFEDRYREAVVSRRPTSFTALRPPDDWLFFELYPDASGISVHITPIPSGHAPTTAPWEQPARSAEPVGATALYHLTHLAATLTEAVGVQDVVDLVADQIVPAFGAQALALMTPEDGRLRIIGYRGYPAELMRRFDAEPLTTDTPAVRVLNTGVPSFYSTFADLKRAYPPAVHQDDKAAWAFLPLIASGRGVGSLVLAYDRTRPFPPAERAILSSLAGLLAQALDRARLYDTKHQLAHTLQAGLLPQTLPRVSGLEVAARYLPAGHGMDVGGDFYDLIRCDESTAAAAIGDVQGHNVTAAALMGQVRTAVHAHGTAGAFPGEVLARTNRLLTDLDPGLFTSCLYVHLDLARHRARLATAGHPPPLLRHPDGRTEVLRLPPGLLLGIEPDADYPTAEIPLPPGTVLALYTDGLVETPGTDIDDSIAHLARQLALARDQTMDALADTLIAHATKSAPRHDDIALLLIRACADSETP